MTAGRVIAATGLAVGLALLILWLSGGLAGLEAWAAAKQRETQAVMAGALRRLRAGEPGATFALISVCFAYGVVHAVGPGHGKLLIGGYGFGTQVPLRRLATLSVAASLAQALVAVVLVWGGITVLNLSRETLTEVTEDRMADVSAVLIGLVGLWLAWRGLRQIAPRAKPHAHHHHHDDACGCGHAHGPTAEQVAQTHGLRDALILITGIAIRPCTGALFLLILTWRMQIFPTGVLGAFAMGLGTASISLVVAALAVWARRGGMMLATADDALGPVARWLPGVMQLAAGSVIAVVAFALVI